MNRVASPVRVAVFAGAVLLTGSLLSGAEPPAAERLPALRKALKDPAASVRARAALALAEAQDTESIPALIDLLAELETAQRQPIEEFLAQVAGEWAPTVQFAADDKIARKIRRDAWAAWWKNTSGDALLEVMREHILTEEGRQKISNLLSRLGSDDFGQRELATRDLFSLGRIALPQLREAVKDRDVEVARRARRLIERIEQEPGHRLPEAAVRMLGLRKPAGAAAALLAYLPHAEEDNLREEVQKSLAALALREGKPEPALVRALQDNRPTIRAAAAEALSAGGRESRAACRPLLKDRTAAVRLRVALALAAAEEREAVAVLIDLLTELPTEEAGQVESALFQLAGDSAPKESLGAEAAEKQKCRDAWVAWWKDNAGRVDFTRMRVQPMLGFTLICDTSRGRVYEIDREGKERWAIDGLQLPSDAWVLPRNRVLIAEYSGNRISERDFKGKVLWSKEGVPNNPVSVQRLANGNTFVATRSGAVLEVDRNGKQVYLVQIAGGVLAGYRLRTGPIVCLTQQGKCIQVDTSGKTLKSFDTGFVPSDICGIDLTPSGRILFSPQQNAKIIEFDTAGKKTLELTVPQAATVTSVPNGHLLVASYQAHRVCELDRAGKVVWEHRNCGHAYHARRR